MGASAGTVTLELDANSVKMVQELQRAQKKTKTSASRMKHNMGSAFKAIAKGAAIMGAAMVASTKVAVALGDKIAKQSRAVGLTAEQYQELAFAAKRAGVEQNQFSSNMTAFVKRVGEAQAGMGPLVSGLKNLNPVLLQNLKNSRNQAEAFDLVADAIQNSESATERAAIANAAFSRAGIGMVNMLDKGAAGLNTMADKARDLGIVMDDDLIANAEETADRFGDLQEILKVSFAATVLENADAIAKMLDVIIEAPKFIGWFIDEFEEMLGVIDNDDFIRLSDKMAGLQKELAEATGDNFFGVTWEEKAASIREEMRVTQNLLDEIEAKARDKAVAAVAPNVVVTDLAQRDVAVQPDFQGLADAIDLEDAALAAAKVNDEIAKLQEQIDTFGMNADEKQIFMLKAMGASPEAIEAVRKQQEELKKLQEIAEVAAADLELIDIAAIKAKRQTVDMNEEITGASEAFGATAMSAFESFANGAESAEDAIKSLIKQMALLIIKQAILAAFGGGGGAGGGFSLASAFGGGKASGGPVESGRTYLIGEQGPELLHMGNSSGMVTPNNEIGGSGVVVNVDARESDNPGRLLALVPLIQEQVEQGVALKLRRGYL